MSERDGYILLHRKGLTRDEWKHPLRTLAWIDFCTMAAYNDFTADDGVRFKRGELACSYGFLATRWRVSKATAYEWIKHWVAEQQVERCSERCSERSAERYFVVNYAKYQDFTERITERLPKRTTEQMKVKEEKQKIKTNTYAVRPETEQLLKRIDELCTQYGLQNSVNGKSLDILVERYLGKVRMNVEVQHCISWLVEKNLRAITTQRIGNWFRKAQEIQKRNENKQLEWKEAQANPAQAARLRTQSVPKPEAKEETLISPEARQQLLSQTTHGL